MKLIQTLLIGVLLYGCSNKSEVAVNILSPKFDISYGELIDEGYKVLPEDVILVGKQFGDTLLYYQFLDNVDFKSKPFYQLCEFPIKYIELDSLIFFFSDRNYFIIMKPEELGSIVQFYIKNSINNLYFNCSVNKKDSTMFMSFDYPQIPN